MATIKTVQVTCDICGAEEEVGSGHPFSEPNHDSEECGGTFKVSQLIIRDE